MKTILQNYLLPSIEGGARGRVFLFLFLFPFLAIAQPLPMDTAVRYGKLENGLTYYIYPNTKPKGLAEYYLVQRVGSILEEDDQQGLAHFLEHMAFNGTKHFPGKRMIEYLEENGVRFGTDINAYTAFDQTVYNLSRVPTQREGLVDSCLLILRDWSGDITLDSKEIDAERKVIFEEWRTKTGARERIYAQTLPKLFPDGNRYASRMPIGKMEVVMNFPHKALRDYYHRWYRPDLQAVIIAGDVDADHVEKQIKHLWEDIPLRTVPERIYYTVPDNASPIVAIGTDPELSSGTLRISYKYDVPTPETTLSRAGQKEALCRNLIVNLLSNRMMDQAKESGQHTSLSFFDGDYSISGTKDAFSITATFRDTEWQPAMRALVFQLKRAMEHGFTAEEYERVKKSLPLAPSNSPGLSPPLPSREGTENAKVSLSSPSGGVEGAGAALLVQKCIAHFLHHRPLLSQADEVKLYHELLADITVADLNARFNQFLYSRGGMAILLQGQAREGNRWPTEAEVLQAYGEGWSQQTTPYRIPETEPAPELMPVKPTPGHIVKEKVNKAYGTHELLLSNGARVVLKPTDNKAGTLQLTAISHGGTSLIDNKEFINIGAINTLPTRSGLANLSGRQLGRALEGSSASYQTNVGTLTETFSGGCKWTDVEDLMQLLHLRFTTVRQDTADFHSWQRYMRQTLAQRIASPMTAFSDTLQATLYEPHPRTRKLTTDLADSVDYDRTCALFMERFANAADFTFIFVGSMDIDSLRPHLCQYIASLPGNPKQREEADLTALPRLRREEHVTRVQVPMENPVTTVIYQILAKERYTARANVACAILSEVMNSLCTATLREQEGGTYSVNVNARISRQPADELTLMYNFNTNPQQAQSLLQQAIALLRQVADEGPSAETFNKAKEYLLKQHTSYRGTDSFWMAALTERVRYGCDDMLTNGETLQQVTPKDVQRLARKLIRSKHTTEVVMNGDD